MKPVSKCLFHFVDTLEPEIFTEGVLDISFYHSINQKTLSTAIKKNPFLFLQALVCVTAAEVEVSASGC